MARPEHPLELLLRSSHVLTERSAHTVVVLTSWGLPRVKTWQGEKERLLERGARWGGVGERALLIG
jgi:hypothetical protein